MEACFQENLITGVIQTTVLTWLQWSTNIYATDFVLYFMKTDIQRACIFYIYTCLYGLVMVTFSLFYSVHQGNWLKLYNFWPLMTKKWPPIFFSWQTFSIGTAFLWLIKDGLWNIDAVPVNLCMKDCFNELVIQLTPWHSPGVRTFHS